METISKLLNIIRQPWLWRTAVILFSCRIALNLVCWIFGAIGLYAVGSRKKITPALPAFLPAGQVWYTLCVADKKRLADRAELLLWWCPTCAIAGFAAVIWAAAHYLNGRTGITFLLLLAAMLLLLSLALYIWLRCLELRGLKRIFSRRTWIISLIGTILGIPVQRIMIYLSKESLK